VKGWSAAVALAACGGFRVFAPQPPAPSFRAETRLVVLHATIKNSRGDDVADLDARAFSVYENGRRQPITLFRRDDIPVSLGLVIDNSGTMRPSAAASKRRPLRSSGPRIPSM
jgi:hypothetical protein